MAQRLTKTALKHLNALMAQGVAYEEALAQVAVWEAIPEEKEASTVVEVANPSTTRAQVVEVYERLFEHLNQVGIVAHDPTNGCTRLEIEALERDTQRTLPFAYTAFLERVGKQRTRLISHDHIAAELHRLRKM